MLKSRILQSGEYDRFLEFNKTNNGGPVDKAYVENATIRVFYNNPDQWVAAYAINTKGKFRYLSVLTDDQSSTLLRRHGIDKQSLVEITLLIRDQSKPWPHKYDRVYYYSMSLLDALATGRQFILGGAVEFKLADAQMEVLDHLLYQGEMNFFGKSTDGWLYYASWFGAVGNALRWLFRVLTNRPNTPGNKPRLTKSNSVPNN